MDQKDPSTPQLETILKSESFSEEAPAGLEASFQVKFVKDGGVVVCTPQDDEPPKSSDKLSISFKSSKPVPAEIKDYISRNLGSFEFSEEGDERRFSFDLKLKDIAFDEINTAYQDFFKGKTDEVILDMHYKRSEPSSQLIERFQKFHRVPLFLHLMEKSQLTLKLSQHSALLDAFFEFGKSSNIALLDSPIGLTRLISFAKLNAVFAPFESLPHQVFEDIQFDQREVFRDFILPFENPLNEFIFAPGEEGYLRVEGTILNILEYSVNVRLPGISELVKHAKQL